MSGAVDNKNPDDGGFKQKLSRNSMRRKFTKGRNGGKKKRPKQQKKSKQKQQQPHQNPQPVVEIAETPRPIEIQTQHYELAPQDAVASDIYRQISPHLPTVDYEVYVEAVQQLGITSYNPEDKVQQNLLMDNIKNIMIQRIMHEDEDTKHTEIKDTALMDISADISMNLEDPEPDSVQEDSPARMESTEMLMTSQNSIELKTQDVSNANMSSTVPMSISPSEEVRNVSHMGGNDDGNNDEIPVVVQSNHGQPSQQSQNHSSDPDGSRRSRKRKRRKKRKGNDSSPANEEPHITTGGPSPVIDGNMGAPDVNGGGRDDEMDLSQPMQVEELDDSAMMNGHDEMEPEYERQPIEVTEQELLEQRVDTFDCATGPQSVVILREWCSRLRNNDHDKRFAQMFHDVGGVEKITSSVLRNPKQSICDADIVELFHLTLMGPFEYHELLFSKIKELAIKLEKHKDIHDKILTQLKQVIAAQKKQPQSSAPEIDKKEFALPSRHWAENANCPSYDMWQNVDQLATSLQETYNLLRREKLQTQLMQPNKNPHFLHSLKTLDKVCVEGTSGLLARERLTKATLERHENELATVNDVKRSKLEPLRKELEDIRRNISKFQAEKTNLETQLARVTSALNQFHISAQDCERRMQQANDFSVKENRLNEEIVENKFALSRVQSEAQCFSDLRAIGLDIYRQLDGWSNERIRDQQEMRDGLAQQYLIQLTQFIDKYTEILQFMKKRMSFAQTLARQRTGERSDALHLYGHMKASEYDDEISRHKREEEADKKVVDKIERNMHSYIEAAEAVVRENRFRDFIFRIEERIGRVLDLNKYKRNMLVPTSVEKSRRDAGSQTRMRDYPSRAPMSSGVSVSGRDPNVTRGRGRVPVMGTQRSGQYARSTSTPNRVVLGRPQQPPAPQTTQKQQVRQPQVPLAAAFPFQSFITIPPLHQQNAVPHSVVNGMPAVHPMPRIPAVQGHLDVDQTMQQRPPRPHHHPIPRRSNRR